MKDNDLKNSKQASQKDCKRIKKYLLEWDDLRLKTNLLRFNNEYSQASYENVGLIAGTKQHNCDLNSEETKVKAKYPSSKPETLLNNK